MEDSSGSSVAQEAVVVKQEPEEAGAGSCGVSEAGAREGLYTDRELKPEAALEPEVVPDHVEEMSLKEEAESLKLEDECERSAALAVLYAGHEVKGELVLGPEGPQLRDVAFAFYAALQTRGTAGGLGQEPAPSLGRGGGQLALRDCVVRIERSPAVEAMLNCSMRQETPKRQARRTTHAKKEIQGYIPTSAEQEKRHSSGSDAAGGLGQEPAPSLGRGGGQLALRDCAVRLERIPDLEALLGRGAPEPQATRTTPAANKTEADKEIHSNTVASTEEEANVCAICRQRFALKSSLIEHVAVHIHTPTSPERGDSRMSSVGQQPPAPQRHTRRTRTAATHAAHSENTRSHPICTKQGKTSGDSKERTRMGMGAHTVEKPHSCEICSKQFRWSSDLKIHSRIHTAEKPYSCEICKKQFTQLSYLKAHRLIHSNTKPYSCEICIKQFRRMSDLKSHKLIHTNIKPYYCEICTKQFREKGHLKAHRLIHSNTKPYSCEICTKQFTQLGNLKTHRLRHSDIKPYSCGICTKQFIKLSTLRVHKLIHTNIKPYSCEICSKKFRSSGQLKKHSRVHTGDKPYSCEICAKQFTILSNLKVHTRIHTNTKPFSCEICSKQFRTSGQLKQHSRVHTGLKPYCCDMCGKRFTWRTGIVSHIGSHMRNDPSSKCNV